MFATKDFVSDNHKEFVPHLTIAKMSKVATGPGRGHKKNKTKKNRKKSKGKEGGESDLRGIGHSTYIDLLDTEFGCEAIEGLELLSMILPPAEDGYYHCFQKHSFDSSLSSLMDCGGSSEWDLLASDVRSPIVGTPSDGSDGA